MRTDFSPAIVFRAPGIRNGRYLELALTPQRARFLLDVGVPPPFRLPGEPKTAYPLEGSSVTVSYSYGLN